MTKKLKISFLLVLFAVVLGIGVYQTYAYLTNSNSAEFEFTIGQINATVEVTGAKNVDATIVNDNLTYIHYVDDFIENKYGLLDVVSSQIKVSIDINNSFDTRVKIMLPELDDLEGLLYIVVDDTTDTQDLEIKLQVADGNLQYGYLQDGEQVEWTSLFQIDSGELDTPLTNETFRDLINTYNYNKLKSLYEDNKYTDETMNFRILFWGDYYSLSDPSNYLERQYKFSLTAKVIQAIDSYGGELDYEND